MMADMMKLLTIQTKLNAPKSNHNPMGFNYRNAEDILAALKPLMEATKTVVLIHDGVEKDGDIPMLTSTATLYDAETATSIAETSFTVPVDLSRSGMGGPAQRYGAASSYARKYALGGLFAIDDGKIIEEGEIDSRVTQQKAQAPAYSSKSSRTKANQKYTTTQTESPKERLRARIRKEKVNEDDFVKFFNFDSFKELNDSDVATAESQFDDLMKQFKESPQFKATQEEIPF